jgi:Carboxypeptidase regulatory-like domain/Photosynthesis system II assembly factor YCF48/Putative zinc-finger
MELLPKIVRERLQATARAEAHPDPDLLAAFMEDALDARERSGVLSHLAHCAGCREVLSLAQAEIENPVIARIAASAEVPPRSAWFRTPVLRWGLLAACVALAASLVLLREEKLARNRSTLAVKQPAAVVGELTQEAKLEPPAKAMQSPKVEVMKNSANEEKKKALTAVNRDKDALVPTPAPAAKPDMEARGVTGGNAFSGESAGTSMPAFAGPRPMPPPPTSQAATASPQTMGNFYNTQPNARGNSALFAHALGGSILGTVTDPSGAAIAGAKVSVKNVSNGLERSTETGHDGSYAVTDLPLGTYTVTISQPGFRTEVTDGVVVDGVLQARNLKQKAQVGTASETVEVSAAGPVSSSATLPPGAVVNRPSVAELPLSGRSVTDMAQGQSQTQADLPAPPVPAGTVDLAKAKAINRAPQAESAAASTTRAGDTAGNKIADAKRETDASAEHQTRRDTTLFRIMASARWTISPEGKVQRSFDQGKSWQDVAVASGTKFRAVSALGLETWAGGDGGALYHSSDGGVIWMRVKPSFNGNELTSDIARVEFANVQHGKLTTNNHEVWTTSDAGLTWRKQ